jgi:hypothetical protein
MVDSVLADAGFRGRYADHLRELVDGVLHPDGVVEKMHRMRDFIAERACQDIADGFSCEEFDDAFLKDHPEGDNPVRVPGLEPFVRARDRRVREALEGE